VSEMTIWREKGKEMELCETSGPDYEERFTKVLADQIVDVLRVPWSHKQLVKDLVISGIESGVRRLLIQFLHSQLEIIGRSFNREFQLEAEIETGHATHAKMSQFIDAIKETPEWESMFSGEACAQEGENTFILDRTGKYPSSGYYRVQRRRD